MENVIEKESVVTESIQQINRKPFSVSDINAINVAVSLNGVDTRGNFSSVIDAYEKMRIWHRQIVKGKDDAYRVNYAIQLGIKKDDPYTEKGLAPVAGAGIEWKDTLIKDDYIVTKREVDLSDWITWVANQIKKQHKLKLFTANTTYLEVHVSWNVWRGYFNILRRRKGILIDHSHDIMETSWNTRALIMMTLLGTEWTFSYRNKYGESHYYYGNIQPIHQELIRLATNAYELPDARSPLSQSDALEALFLFYEKYPDFKVSLLTNHYLVEDIIQLSSPQYDESLRQSALPLLHLVPPEDSLPSMEKIYEKLLSQLEQWKRNIDSNKIVIEKLKESVDKESKDHKNID